MAIEILEKTSKTASQEAVWTVMVLMGADNVEGEISLKEPAEDDLKEMESVALDPAVVNVVVQVDDADGPRRFYVRHKDQGGRRELSGDDGIPPHDDRSGPDMLENFVGWAKENYPAQHYLLVMWGHAYRLAFNRDPDDPTGLAFPELQRVLENTNGDKKLDIVAFDSCNISLMEGAYQLRDVADYMVASQFTDPLPGWPYDVILQRILDDDDHFGGSEGPKDLGRAIVSQFVRHYSGQKTVTMTTVDLSRVDDIADRFADLATQLVLSVDGNAAELSTVEDTLQRSQVPIDQPSVDLTTFCWNLLNFSGSEKVRIAAASLGDLLLNPTDDPFIVAQGRSDLLAAMLQGVSILAPSVADSRGLDLDSLRTDYDALDFAHKSVWAEFVFSLTQPQLSHS